MPLGRDSHCSEDDLSAYLDAQLPEGARERCAAHLDACSACRQALDGLSAVRSSLRALPRAAAPRSFRLREADVGSGQPKAPWTVRAVPLLSGVSAVSLVAFVALVGVSASGGIDLGTSSSKDFDGSVTSLQADGAATSAELSESSPLVPEAASGETPDVSAGSSETQAFRNSTAYDNADSQGAAPVTPDSPPAPIAITAPADGDQDDNNAWYIAEAVAAAMAVGAGGPAFAAYRRNR